MHSEKLQVIKNDPWLEPHKQVISKRVHRMQDTIAIIEKSEGSIDEFSKGYNHMGFVIKEDGILYTEWAPNAIKANLIGDFSTIS